MSEAACPSFGSGSGVGDAGFGVAHALSSVDCNMGGLVASSYTRLFGAHGTFDTVLTVLLTLYVGFIALGLMTGRTRLTLSGLAPKGMAIGLVLTFATSWPAYQTLVYGLLVNGPEQIAASIMGGHGSTLSFALRLDHLLDQFAQIAKTMGDDAPGASKPLGPLAGPQMAASLVWLSAMLILIGSAGALILTRIVLGLLLAMGPVFVVLGLFRQTRGLLEGWLRTTLMFALAPTLTVLAGTAAVALMEPLVDGIAQDPARAIVELRPILELFLGAVVYVGLVAMMIWTAASLVRGWRIGGGRAEIATTSAASSMPADNAGGGAMSSLGAAASQAPADPRVGQMMISMSRDAGQAPASLSVRVDQAAAQRMEPTGAVTPGTSPQRRTQGLGQDLRPAARLPQQAGALK